MNQKFEHKVTRRGFIRSTSAATAGLIAGCSTTARQRKAQFDAAAAGRLSVAALPTGSSPAPLPLPHFPDQLHAFVWRNWPLVPLERIAAVIGATRVEVLRLGRQMGLPPPPRLTPDQQRRSCLTVIKRNWQLLPYDQLLKLLDWTAEQLASALREDDFLFVKLGNLKPRCEPQKYEPPDEKALARAHAIARILQEEFPSGMKDATEPLFSFVGDLSRKPSATKTQTRATQNATRSPPPRFCYSYFALYGDPLLNTDTDPYPEGYLARLAEAGVDGVWLQAVLAKLAPLHWEPGYSAHYEERLKNLATLAARAQQYGVSIYLYLNEPRAMPLSFFETRPHLKGVAAGDQATLCTSLPEVQNYLVESIATICRAVPDLGGFFTISASENLTNCWSHNGGANCPRCGKRSPAEVMAELNGLFLEGIKKSKSAAGAATERETPRLIVWDWGWADAWAEDIINRLPPEAALMSVSEWGLPIQRGGVQSTVGEYCISAIGPGPRARRHWDLARRRGLKTVAKIQAGNTWELSAVPYIPAVANVARHAANLRQAKVDGIMLGWTLGGYPSPNLEVVAAIEEAEQTGDAAGADLPQRAMEIVASRRFGKILGPAIVEAWGEFSAAFSEFPFHIGVVYTAPLQVGPANLLWAEPTGYHASMVGFPYDDLDSWRAAYPPETFITQLEKVATGFDQTVRKLEALTSLPALKTKELRALLGEINVAEAAAIHFRSTANQARFVLARRALLAAKETDEAVLQIESLQRVLQTELTLARRLHALQSRDSRIGFEASNQYYYVPIDLAEKVLNCRDLLDRWLPSQREKWGKARG